MGRKTKLTHELTGELCRLLKEGAWIEDACACVGIAPSTFYLWMRRGERGWKIDREGGFSQFSQAIKSARAEAAMTSLRRIRKAGQGGTWQADAWFLERSYPQRWGRRYQQTEISGPEGRPVTIEVKWSLPRPVDDDGEAED